MFEPCNNENNKIRDAHIIFFHNKVIFVTDHDQ